VVAMADLLDDIESPSMSILEPYGLLLQMSHEADAAAREDLFKQWDKLKKLFDERHAYWESLPDGVAKQALLRDSNAVAHAFFEIGDKEFIPAARAGDQARMHALAIGSLREQYQKHRAQIEIGASAATKLSETYVANAAATIESRKRSFAL